MFVSEEKKSVSWHRYEVKQNIFSVQLYLVLPIGSRSFTVITWSKIRGLKNLNPYFYDLQWANASCQSSWHMRSNSCKKRERIFFFPKYRGHPYIHHKTIELTQLQTAQLASYPLTRQVRYKANSSALYVFFLLHPHCTF